MDLLNNLLNDVSSDFDPGTYITSGLQQGKAYRNYSIGYVSQVLPEIALMGGKPAKGTDFAAITESLTGEILIEDIKITGDDSSQNKFHTNKGSQNIGNSKLNTAQSVKNTTHFIGTKQEKLDKSKQEEEFQHIEDEYQRLLSQYNREYETTLESLLKITTNNKPVTIDLEKRVDKVEKLGNRLNVLALKLEKRTDQLTQVHDKIKHNKEKTGHGIVGIHEKQQRLSDVSKKAGISPGDMQSLQGQYEDANNSLTSHYYHYLMWIIVAITLASFVTHVLTANNSNPMNIIIMIIILIAFLFVLRAIYHYWSTHTVILR